ncbi:MAG: cob(I)yrinic acid a,c-diamide adenosyltransferase [Alphaproteobacteria bacterium]|nr:cob(I)yrinic acid a,c-diamide adenosyltransferase [Alphaproteobacteria bacterium]
MVRLTRIYTKTGDKGETSLGDGSRVAKNALRVEAFGAVDEANAAVGLARLHAKGDLDAMLARIQNDLFDLGADLCVPETTKSKRSRLRIAEAQVVRLEGEIDQMNAELKPLDSFVLPGGSAAAAHLHLARAIVRRAERLMVALAQGEKVGEAALRYINRLSDHLFVASRFANAKGAKDVLWVPGANRKEASSG